MAQQDKTDWYWNGVLAGAVNNLYYDLINVDVVHVPYTTTHRNSSFFLKTRPGYCISRARYGTVQNRNTGTIGREPKDMKIIWDETCKDEKGTAYVLAKKGNEKALFVCPVNDGCVGISDGGNEVSFYNCTEACSGQSYYDECPELVEEEGCGDRKLFTTDFVKGRRYVGENLIEPIGQAELIEPGVYTGIQINKYTAGKTIGLFSDQYVESKEGRFKGEMLVPGNYLLVYASGDLEGDGFAGQVRMITGTETKDGVTRVIVDEPRLGFKVPDTSDLKDGEEKTTLPNGLNVSYAVFKEWGEVVGYTANNKIYIMYNNEDCRFISPYYHKTSGNSTNTQIIGVASASNKIFVLTDNGFVHYSSEGQGYNKFFIEDDMYAGVDKSSIVSYRDMVLAFGRKHIAIGVPDDQNEYWTMYDQSATTGVRSRYSYAEYDGDLVFVSNDKRLLALGVAANTGRYMLQHDDVGEALNGKLATLLDTDEVFVGGDNNNLRVFVQTKSIPYIAKGHPREGVADRNMNGVNTMTHIYKYDTLFKVWSEDHIPFLLSGVYDGAYYGMDGVYIRRYSEALSSIAECDVQGTDTRTYWPYTTRISAYLVENEADWVGGTNSRLSSRPKLYNVAKLNRLITTLGPGVYSNTARIRITNYSKGIGYTYEFPISGDGNNWLGLITDLYLGKELSEDDEKKLECMLSVVQDNQKKYQPKCTNSELYYHTEVQKAPRCESYREFIIQDHGVCVNDSMYQLAPTMPLVTDLGESQDYSTQIKLELIGEQGDIICFGGWLAEMFIAPLFTKGPDGEYQLQPNTDC